jgi:hypothetical protein
VEVLVEPTEETKEVMLNLVLVDVELHILVVPEVEVHMEMHMV